MLTSQDLSQIKTIVEEVVEEKLEQKLEQKLNEKFTKELKPIHKTLNKIQKDLTTTINYFDNNFLGHEKRIRKIETRLQITESL